MSRSSREDGNPSRSNLVFPPGVPGALSLWGLASGEGAGEQWRRRSRSCAARWLRGEEQSGAVQCIAADNLLEADATGEAWGVEVKVSDKTG